MAKFQIKYTPVKFVLPIDVDSMQGQVIDYQIDSSNYLANYIIHRLKNEPYLFKVFIDKAYGMDNFGYALCKITKEIIKEFGTAAQRRIKKIKLKESDENAVDAYDAIPSAHFEYVFKRIGNEIGTLINTTKKEDISNFDSKYLHINWLYCKDGSELGSIYRFNKSTGKFDVKVPKVDLIEGVPNLYKTKLKLNVLLPVAFILKNIDKENRVSYVISFAVKNADIAGSKSFEGAETISIVLSGPYAKDTSIYYRGDKSIESIGGYEKVTLSLNPSCVDNFNRIFEGKDFRYMDIKGDLFIQAYIESITSTLISLNPKTIVMTSILTDYADLYAPMNSGYSISRNFYMMIENVINRFCSEYDVKIEIVEAMDPELQTCVDCKSQLTERGRSSTLFSKLRSCISSDDCVRTECGSGSGCGLALELPNHLGIKLLKIHSKDTFYY